MIYVAYAVNKLKSLGFVACEPQISLLIKQMKSSNDCSTSHRFRRSVGWCRTWSSRRSCATVFISFDTIGSILNYGYMQVLSLLKSPVTEPSPHCSLWKNRMRGWLSQTPERTSLCVLTTVTGLIEVLNNSLDKEPNMYVYVCGPLLEGKKYNWVLLACQRCCLPFTSLKGRCP